MRPADDLGVLVVDDEPGMRRTLGDLLELNGYAPRAAETGKSALALASESSFSVAIVDLRLPDFDGLDLAARLREPDDRMQVIILTGNATVESAIRAVRDQGCDYLVKPVEPEELMRTVGAAKDRWLLRAAEDNLRVSELLLEGLFEASPLPLMVLDADLRVHLWNGSAERVFGWSAEEVRGERMPAIDPEGKEDTDRLLERVLRGEPMSGVEVKRRTRAGALLDVRMTAAAVRNVGGTLSAVMVTFEDMTERIQLEEHLRHVQRLDAVGRLAGGIAHDFNNLLAVIRTEADLTLHSWRLPREVHASLTTVRETADRGAGLTRQLLTFARRQPMKPSVVEANEVVANLERMLRRLIPEPVRLELELDQDVGHVNVDRGQLEQVITNLVINARDAVAGSGRVAISTGRKVHKSDHTPLGLDSGDWVVISVKDDGGGIPESIHGRIFEPFFTTKGPESGTGLGLATSYGIVKSLGGHIALESAVGAGSTFHVCLPLVSPAEVGRDQDEEPGRGTGSEKILLVEDDSVLRDVTGRILIRLGYSVHAASDGAEAWAALEGMEEPPDLLLCDAHLPLEDGRDLIAAIQKRHPGIRALLTSGSFELANRDDIDVPFIEKPYTMEALASAVRAALDG